MKVLPNLTISGFSHEHADWPEGITVPEECPTCGGDFLFFQIDQLWGVRRASCMRLHEFSWTVDAETRTVELGPSQSAEETVAGFIAAHNTGKERE